MYDIIVIGAGPAGCTAAKVLADLGYKVLIVEKCALPRYKSCSGMLIKKTIDLVDKYFGESIPESVTCAPAENKGMIFTNDAGQEYRFEQQGLNVWRGAFDFWLTGLAEKSGAVLRDRTAAVSCSCDVQETYAEVKLRCKEKGSYTEKAKYVIDCEGVVGAVKRKLLQSAGEYITTYQTFNKGTIALDLHYFYAYLQPELSEYDAWFNVKDNMLVLGVSGKDASKISMYYHRFIAYMEANHGLQINKCVRAEKWLMPHISAGCPIEYGKERVLFAGEAAGFLNPMGEGISAGMESGYCAASAIAAHFDDVQSVYALYQKETLPLQNYMMRQWSFAGRLSGTFQHMKMQVI